MKVDIIRFIIIYKYGGIYLDLDVVPNIKKIENENDFYLSIYKNHYEMEVIQSPKNNPIMLEYLNFNQIEILN